jgi:L-alanine-DL-glutamate epimerase-like enolase superfamily enzyme
VVENVRIVRPVEADTSYIRCTEKLSIRFTVKRSLVGNRPLPHGTEYESYIIYEAYEMAWLDLLGKHLGVPVHHLLGGKLIDRVPID